MLTIELEAKKSITKFDLEQSPTTAYVEYRGELYHIEKDGGLMWEQVGDPLPDGADVTVIDIDGSMVLKKAEHAAPASLPETLPEAPHDASPDQPKDV